VPANLVIEFGWRRRSCVDAECMAGSDYGRRRIIPHPAMTGVHRSPPVVSKVQLFSESHCATTLPASQSFTVPLSLPLASVWPCGSNATLLTGALWPASVRSSLTPGGRVAASAPTVSLRVLLRLFFAIAILQYVDLNRSVQQTTQWMTGYQECDSRRVLQRTRTAASIVCALQTIPGQRVSGNPHWYTTCCRVVTQDCAADEEKQSGRRTSQNSEKQRWSCGAAISSNSAHEEQ